MSDQSKFGFRDMRDSAELMLSPARPASRAMLNFNTMRLDIGGKIDIPGVITNASQLTGSVRAALSGAVALKQHTAELSVSLNGTLTSFDASRAAAVSGLTPSIDPMFAGHLSVSNGVPEAQAFFQFSSLKPGQTIPASFQSIINDRKAQLQNMTARISSAASGGLSGGVSLTEDFNKLPYPLPRELDLPTIPRLSVGGAVAQTDDIIKDKMKFVVAGVQVGAGKPSFWSRLTNLAQIQAVPGLNTAVNQIFKDKQNSGAWSEPTSPYAAQHPFNKAQQTDSGHVFELDDTPGAERIHIFHRSGSFVEFHPDGTVVYKNMKDGYLLTMNDHFVKVTGKCNLYVGGNASVFAKGNIDIQSDGEVNFQVKKDFNVFADNINLRAKKTFKGDGMEVNLRYINLPMQIVPVMEGALVPMVNLAALSLDFPTGNFTEVLAAAKQGNLDPEAMAGLMKFSTGDETVPIPPENPLANPEVYTKKTEDAVAYRAHLFDTPEETENFELYAAHIGLQKLLEDIPASLDPTEVVPDPRQLGGTLRVPATDSVSASTPRAVNYLNFDAFSGQFIYANTYALGGTSFQLQDLVDVSIASSVVSMTKRPAAAAVGVLDSSAGTEVAPGQTPNPIGGGGSGGAAQAPNMMSILQQVLTSKPWKFTMGDAYDKTQPDGRGGYTEAAVAAMHAQDARFGHIRKNPGQNQYNGHAVDAINFKDDDGKTSEIYDIISSTIQWNFVNRSAANLKVWYF